MQSKQTVNSDYRKQIANIILRQLRGDFSDSLTRFSYVDGSNDFLKLIQSPNYFGYAREITLIDRIIPRIIRRIGDNSQIIDLGPGNGQKAIRILTHSSKKISSYVALDMSQQMLNAARSLQNRITSVSKEYKLCDFSNPIELSRESNTSCNQERLFLLLGNTLTNEVDLKTFLRNFKETVNLTSRSRNYLLIGVELLNQDVNRIVSEYQNEDNYVLTLRPLEMLGMNRKAGRIDISFNRELRRIEEKFRVIRPSIINTNLESIGFEEGDVILLSVTYKPTLEELQRIIRETGWKVEDLELEENQVMMLLSSRSRLDKLKK